MHGHGRIITDVWTLVIAAIGIGTGLTLIIFGPRIDEWRRRRGGELGPWFRVPARIRGVITLIAGVSP
jgi:hypothetical protein